MTTPTDLMGAGIPALPAGLLGFEPVNLTAAGTAQGGASPTLRLGTHNFLTTAAGQTAVTLPANVSPGREIRVSVVTATTALVYPPVGGTIDQGGVDASQGVATNLTAVFIAKTANDWVCMVGA